MIVITLGLPKLSHHFTNIPSLGNFLLLFFLPYADYLFTFFFFFFQAFFSLFFFDFS